MATKTQLSVSAEIALSVLKNFADGATLSEINENLPEGASKVQPGTITGLVKRGLIEVIGEREVEKTSKRNVAVYEFNSSAELADAEGKAFNYNDNQKAILNFLENAEDKEFTISGLKEKVDGTGINVSSGVITALVKRGNLVKTEKTQPALSHTKASVNVYGVVEVKEEIKVCPTAEANK